jgi:hypothetical protein
MGTIIFVHGTGVREDSYKKSLSRVGEKLLAKRADLALIPCFWGEKFGSITGQKLRSIPDEGSSRSPDSLNEDDYDTGMWGLLYDDPLYELRVLSLQPGQLARGAPNQLSPYQQIDGAVKKIKIEGEIKGLLGASGLDKVWSDAVQAVGTSKEYISALSNAPVASDDYRQAIARAFVAQAVLIVRDQQKLRDDESPIRAEDRDQLVDLLLEQLGAKRGLLGLLAKQVIGRPATFFIRRRRAKYSELASPAIGDILLYQARGERIRDLIREKVKEAKPPVILLAHSLGGIASVDLLILESLPEVKILVTAGSQSPLFYEIGALRSLESGKPLPDHFPKHWLNIYDPRDFLSYLAQPVFPNHQDRKIADVQVNNREPFPQSHTSYWDNDEVWEAISKKLNEVMP